MVLPGHIPEFSLDITPDKLKETTQVIINGLYKTVKEITELAEKSNTNKLDLLKKWHIIESEAATKQTYCTLPSLVHFDSNVRAASALAKKQLKDTWNDLYSQEKLYNVFKSIRTPEDPVEKQLLSKTLYLFKRNGLDLDPEKHKLFHKLQLNVTDLENKFIQNINENVTTLSFTLPELNGCSETFINGLEKKVEMEDGKEKTKYYVTLKPPEIQTLLQSGNVDETRKAVLTASHSKCKEINYEIFKELIATRQNLAHSLNYDNHANFMLSQNMVKSLDKANDFLFNILNSLRPKLEEELKELLDLKEKTCKKNSWTFDHQINLWDIAYYEKILKDTKYAMDDEEISNYFPVEVVIKGILDL